MSAWFRLVNKTGLTILVGWQIIYGLYGGPLDPKQNGGVFLCLYYTYLLSLFII